MGGRRPRLQRYSWLPIALLVAVAPIRIFAADPGVPDVPLNMLPEPVAPGVVLLGTAPATVERPGSAADITATITNATGSATAAASNFALQIAPYWWLHAPKLTYEKYKSDDLVNNFLQTASLSLVTGSVAKAPGTALGFGARFSLARGNVDTVFNGYADSIRKIWESNDTLTDSTQARRAAILDHDAVLARLQKAAIVDTARVTARIKADNARAEREVKDAPWYKRSVARINSVASNTPLQRCGWKLDAAGGFALNFRSSVYDSAEFGKSGGWLTGGYEHRYWSLIGTVRCLAGADTTSLDFGARFTLPAIKVAVPSFEFIYRACPTTLPSVMQRIRFDGLVDVPVGTNKAVSVTVGRDFGTWQKAKMILVLKLHMGFGTNRPL